MKFWEHLHRKYWNRSANQKKLVIGSAYRAVFYGNADRPQQQMVLADLQSRCGWNTITHPKYASDREVWFAEGKRAAFGEIFDHLSLSPADIEALNNAARVETAYENTNQDA